jgi:electron transfer flavoprotein alpha subunit
VKVLVLIEHGDGALKDATLASVTAASKLGSVHVLVAGEGPQARSAAEAAASVQGVEKVLLAAHPAYGQMLAENLAALIVPLMDEYDALVCDASSNGKNIAPRVAAMLDVMQISDIISVEDERTFNRPIYAGNAIATVESADPKLVITVRGTAFEKAAADCGTAAVEEITGPGEQGLSEFVGCESAASERPDLASAGVVVSGGRALKDAETFDKLITPLADKLHAAIGASRAAVDAGYISNDHQVGQTGKIVAPALYVAVGISGAIQHLAGMKESKVIVAINKDPDAPIFQVADVGLVADLFEAVPDLTSKL